MKRFSVANSDLALRHIGVATATRCCEARIRLAGRCVSGWRKFVGRKFADNLSAPNYAICSNYPRTTEITDKATMASTTDREGEERPVSAPQTPTHNPTVSSPRASSPDIITPVSPSHTYSLFQDNTYIEYDTLPDSLDEWTKAAIQHKQVGGSIFNL